MANANSVCSESVLGSARDSVEREAETEREEEGEEEEIKEEEREGEEGKRREGKRERSEVRKWRKTDSPGNLSRDFGLCFA